MSARRLALDPGAEGGRRIVAQGQCPQRTAEELRDREQDDQRQHECDQLAGAGLPDRPDQPGHRLASLVDVGLRDQVGDDREQEL